MSQSNTADALLAEISQLEHRLDELRQQLGLLEPASLDSGSLDSTCEQGRQNGTISLSAVLEYLVAGTAAEAGEGFFRSLAQHLAEATGVACVLISELIDKETTRVRTLAVWKDGRLDVPTEIELAGTPCEVALGCGEFICEEGVSDRFPKDTQLSEMQAVSYYGVRFCRRNGEPLGNICLIDTKPLSDVSRLLPFLRLFAARVGLELERTRSDHALQESESRLRLALASAQGGAWEWELALQR